MPEAKSENADFGGKPVCPVSVFGVSGNFQTVIPEKIEKKQKPKIRHSRREFGFFEIRLSYFLNG
ncbi:hypothetical protein [Neisseria polysaccharea]|uniref:hypothetical protein n=1 Tax=Neisseria polysaccharea TaxID=489 RepID=UPI0027E11D35|nr:hypothetical protein [Neisseria polysaccharea]